MIYGVHTNFRLNRKKNFKGHMVCTCVLVQEIHMFIICHLYMYVLPSLSPLQVAGYACGVDFSPDGRSAKNQIEPLCY